MSLVVLPQGHYPACRRSSMDLSEPLSSWTPPSPMDVSNSVASHLKVRRKWEVIPPNDKKATYPVLCKRTYSYDRESLLKTRDFNFLPQKNPCGGYVTLQYVHRGPCAVASPGIVCPTYTSCVFHCCPGNLAAWSQGSVGRTILNNPSIKAAAKTGLLERGTGQGSRACSHSQCSSILPSRCLALWVFLTVMAEEDRALRPSYFFVTWCASWDWSDVKTGSLMWVGRAHVSPSPDLDPAHQ